MNLYLISQNTHRGYGTYSGAVVVAETEKDAINIHPSGRTDDSLDWKREGPDWGETSYSEWSKKEDIKVKLLGKANDSLKRGVVLFDYLDG